MTQAVAIELDSVLGDTRGLWLAFLDDASRRFRSIAPLDPSDLPEDRGAAAADLDAWAARGIGDWRAALERFAEDHAPVYLQPSAEVSAGLRALAARGWHIGVFTDAPEPLARVALAHLGAARRVAELETGAGAFERLVRSLDSAESVEVARSPADLARISSGGA